MARMPDACPSCSGRLVVTQLSCPACSTTVTGAFDPGTFANLAREDLDFVLLFVGRKGNLKEMERDLGISYWTIRRRLDEIVERLGPTEVVPALEREGGDAVAILSRLRDGGINVTQAVALLRGGSEAEDESEREAPDG